MQTPNTQAESVPVRVMGPDASSSATSNNWNRPPTFVKNQTSKTRYHVTLRRWVRMIRKFGDSDNKYKAVIHGIGHIIYIACDDNSQELLARAEKSGSVNLEGRDGDGTIQRMVEKIINVISKDTPSERVRREAELLSNIQTCVRNESETPEQFANRFNAAVARFSNQTGTPSRKESNHFAVVLIRNAKLTPDSLNALTFQLTTQNKDLAQYEIEVQIPISRLQNIVEAMRYAIDHREDKPNNHMNLIRNEAEGIEMIIENANSDDNRLFTLNQAVATLSQVKVDTRVATQHTMLGKRKFGFDNKESAKRNSSCLFCGEHGHWYRDRKHVLTGLELSVIR